MSAVIRPAHKVATYEGFEGQRDLRGIVSDVGGQCVGADERAGVAVKEHQEIQMARVRDDSEPIQ